MALFLLLSEDDNKVLELKKILKEDEYKAYKLRNKLNTYHAVDVAFGEAINEFCK